jgi:hypothetical protein
MLPATGIDRKYAEFFCSIGNKFFWEFGNGALVIVTADEKEANHIKLFITKTSLEKTTGISNTGISKGREFNLFNGKIIGFLPTILFLALVIATPLTWKRKIFALFFGFFLLTAFIMMKLRVIILYAFATTPEIGLFQEPEVKKSIEFWYNYFPAQLTPSYSFSVIVWLAVCIGKKEWQKLNRVFSETVTIKKSTKQSSHAGKKMKQKQK